MTHNQLQNIRSKLLLSGAIAGGETVIQKHRRHKALSQLDAILARRASFHNQKVSNA